MNNNSTETLERENVTQREGILDLKGRLTDIPLNKRNIILIVISILVLVICSRMQLGEEAPLAGFAVGVTISSLILMISGTVSLGTGGLLVVIAGLLSGLLTRNDILSSSLFYQFTGFCIVGYGAEATPFGRRLSYWLLKTFGSRPAAIVTVFLLAPAFLSSFLSNTATMILMASICHQVMKQMGQEPGKSKFAAACMIAATIGPLIGCCGFVQGSPGIVLLSLQQMQDATVGGYTINALQWAEGGWLTLLFVLPLSVFLIIRFLRYDPKDVGILSKEYCAERLKELGGVSGSEIRWLIYVAAMIVLMIAGVDSTKLIIVLIVLCVLPGVGIFSAKTAFTKAVPWEIIICGVSMSTLGTIFSNSGLSNVVAQAIAPKLAAFPPFLLMFTIALVIAALSMYAVASTYACVALGITMMAPIVEAAGLNPAIILFPTIISLSYMFGLFAQPIVTQNYRYGYWKKWDITLIGSVVAFAAVLINCLVSYFLLPAIWGMPLHI